MAVKQVFVSDISGKEIEEGSSARIVVSDHPVLGARTVELDADVSEVEKLESSKLTMVSVAIYMPGESSPQRVILDAGAFDKLFKGNVEEVLLGARTGGMAEPQRRRGRPAGTRSTSSTTRPGKTDYSSLEHAGQPHRGRVTEAEAETVRNNLDEINARLAAEGQRIIDPADADMKRKYGF